MSPEQMTSSLLNFVVTTPEYDILLDPRFHMEVFYSVAHLNSILRGRIFWRRFYICLAATETILVPLPMSRCTRMTNDLSSRWHQLLENLLEKKKSVHTEPLPCTNSVTHRRKLQKQIAELIHTGKCGVPHRLSFLFPSIVVFSAFIFLSSSALAHPVYESLALLPHFPL